MDNLARVDQFNNRSFISASHNVCKLTKIGEGGIRCVWRRNPTEADITEFNAWFQSVLGAEANIHTFKAGKLSAKTVDIEKKAYEDWLKS